MQSSITQFEAKSILLILNKINLTDHETVENLCDYLRDKEVCASEDAVRVLESLEHFRDTGEKPRFCPICQKELEPEAELVCLDCCEMVSRIAEESPTVYDSEETEVDSSENINLKRVIPAFIILLCIVVGGIFGLVKYIEVRYQHKLVPRRFKSIIAEEEYTLGTIQQIDDGVVSYDIYPTHENLVIFTNGNDRFEGAALNLAGTDEVNRRRHVTMMRDLNLAVFKGIDDTTATNLVAEIANYEGQLQYDNYQCMLVMDGAVTMYYIINTDNIEVISQALDGNSEASDAISEIVNGDGELEAGAGVAAGTGIDSESAQSNLNEAGGNIILDGLDLIGQNKNEANSVLGSAEQVIAQNTLYYSSVGASVVYTVEDGQIIYIDCDGTGTDAAISIAGMYVGETKENISSYLAAQGLEADTLDDELSLFVSYDDMNIEVTITFKDEIAVLLTACLQK